MIEHIWDGSVNSLSNSIRVHISSLRKKLRTALGFDPIQNKIGQGYILTEDIQWEKNNRKAISSMASDTDHRTAYDSHLHSDVFFFSQSAVAGMEDLGDYMIRIDNTDSAPITFNMNPSVLFPGAFRSAAADQKTFSHQRTHGNRDHHPSQQHLHLFYQPSGITSASQTQPGGKPNRGPEPFRGS